VKSTESIKCWMLSKISQSRNDKPLTQKNQLPCKIEIKPFEKQKSELPLSISQSSFRKRVVT